MQTATQPTVKASDLRVGNYAIHEGQLKKILGIFDDRVVFDTDSYFDDYSFSVNELQPIPLSPEILKAAGFIDDGGTWSKNSFMLDDLNDVFVPISESDWQPIGNEIKYLHQLQNLYFALTGEDLIINL